MTASIQERLIVAFVLTVVIIVSGAMFAPQLSQLPRSAGQIQVSGEVAACIVVLTAFALVGFFSGGIRINGHDENVASFIGATAEELKSLHGGKGTSLEPFVSAIWVFIVIYLVGYFFVLSHADTHIGPGWIPVVVINVITLFMFSRFSSKYALFVLTLAYLDKALREHPVNLTIVNKLCASVRREETILDPPGNIFVTIGIAATFLGLAASLAMLDLGDLMGPREGVEIQGQASPETLRYCISVFEKNIFKRNGIHHAFNPKSDFDNASVDNCIRSENSRDAVSAVIRCMSIALGSSMLGVLIAIACQWFRGRCCGVALDDLFRRTVDAQPKIP